MSSESLALHQLAKAIDDWEKIKAYIKDIPETNHDMGLRLEWSWASSCTGYEEVRGIVKKEVNKLLLPLILATLEQQGKLVNQLRKQVKEHE